MDAYADPTTRPFKLFGRLLSTPHALNLLEPVQVEDPLLPFPEILNALEAGEKLTTGQIIARMGLLATPLLQRRVARALAEYGLHRTVTAHGHRWTAAAPDPVSLQFRRIHEDSDRARGLTPLSERIASFFRWRS
ncbi:hypothetical protein [Sphingomonas koreensis]